MGPKGSIATTSDDFDTLGSPSGPEAQGGGSGWTTYAPDTIVHTPKPNQPKPKGEDLGSMSVLAFPINVEFDAMQGHYIMFHIKNWVESGSRLNASKLSVGPRPRAGENVSNYSLTLINRPMTRLAASIALYMPPQVNVSYGMKYADKEVGVVAHGAAAAMNAWKNTPGTLSALGAAAGQSVGVMGIAAKEMIIKAMDAMIPGLGAVEGITSGNIITPHMELMFEGVGRREFSFSFVMIPKSPPEAVMIEKIVKEFKLGMHPDYTEKSIMGFTGGQTSEDEQDMGVWNPVQGSILKTRAMTFPSVFEIEYFYKGAPSNHLHKISTCYLTKMDVSHGGDRYATYAEGVPQKTMITLNFTELEIMTRKHIKADY